MHCLEELKQWRTTDEYKQTEEKQKSKVSGCQFSIRPPPKVVSLPSPDCSQLLNRSKGFFLHNLEIFFSRNLCMFESKAFQKGTQRIVLRALKVIKE